MIIELDAVVPGPPPEPLRDSERGHPMRLLTRELAFRTDAWTPDRQVAVAELFDSLAPDWPTGDYPEAAAALEDAFDRGLDAAPRAARRRLVDLGGGNGRATQVMYDQFPGTVIVDLSAEMLARIDAGMAPRIQADAASLPFANGAIDVLVLANMFLFPAEVNRVLASGGVLVWLNSWGEHTPIHLSAEEVDRALGNGYAGVWSRAGTGTWSVHWRVA